MKKQNPMPPTPTAPSTWQAWHDALLAEFTEALGQTRLWWVLPHGARDPAQAQAVYDSETGLTYPGAAELTALLKAHPFLYLRPRAGSQWLATLHTATRLLWNHEISDNYYSVEVAKALLRESRFAGLFGWRLPSQDMLWTFATASGNPHRQGREYLLASWGGSAVCWWLTAGGRCDVEKCYWGVNSSGNGAIFACHDLWCERSDAELLRDLAQHGWQLASPDGRARFTADERWKGLSPEALLRALWREGLELRAADESRRRLDPRCHVVDELLTDIDYTPCRLPRLERPQLTDPHKGLWELWGEDAAFLRHMGWVARDPGRDLRKQAVAIDFGTSSTVVAVENAHGQRELLRIGVRDFYAPPEPAHFENPTVLECLDFQAFWRAWTAQAQRPPLNWDHMRAAHEAQASEFNR